MSVSKEELVEALSSMSIIEVTELVSELEEKWGVSAASAVAMAPVAAGDAGAVEEKD
jgi:large subunit ribosomal protein L7/L12